MNKLIERYIYDVTRRLPEKDRAEVGRELEASIADMLPDNPGKEDIEAVLTKLGPPRVLAEKYREKPRYLISPAMFELYISVLKMVVLIVAVVCACIGAITSLPSGSIEEIISTIISSLVEGALQAAFWVTLGFAIYEHFGPQQKDWTIRDLPDLPDQPEVKISRSSSIVGMILSVFFTILFILLIVRNEFILIFTRDMSTEIIIPFSQSALDRLIPYIILFGCLGLIINCLKLYWARWNIPLCVANIIQNIVWVIVAIYILHWPDLFSEKFIAFANTISDDASAQGFISSGGIVIFFSVIFVVAAALDIASSVRNTWKGMREPALRDAAHTCGR